jgi:hypothetical protein
MTQLVEVADVVDGTFANLAQFEPAPDALDVSDIVEDSVADAELQWIVWKAADVSTEHEWATMELISLSIMC